MGDKSLILKPSFLLSVFFVLNLNAVSVLISKEAIPYESKLQITQLRVVNVSTLKKACVPLKLNEVKTNDFITTHYINRNSILCKKDVKVNRNNAVVFNFGAVQIEKKGKIVFENDKFIRIKKEDGKIEKIYKDGRLK